MAEILIYTFGYGVSLYVILCEWLMRGANKLTERRGEHWPKEIDYLYLSLATFGIIATVLRSEASVERAWMPGTLTAMILTTALVLRFIKTRAEVGGWNKPGAVTDPSGDWILKEEAKRAARRDERDEANF